MCLPLASRDFKTKNILILDFHSLKVLNQIYILNLVIQKST